MLKMGSLQLIKLLRTLRKMDQLALFDGIRLALYLHFATFRPKQI